ncbi:MAG: MBL fold metallo-hydrolase [Bacteroidales bacterium]|nr:MBL fold metallo-hydrolase [Bacteroidales bacterium]
MKLIVIETENFKVDGGAMFGVIPKSLWSKVYPCDENNMCNLANRCLLIETNDRRILIDCGIGDKLDSKFRSYFYISGDTNLYKSLEKNGYKITDITDVILTHLHWDHCGGATKYNENKILVPVFPNAIYWVSEKQWNRALNPNLREKAAYITENFIPLKKYNVVNYITENQMLFPGIEVRIYNGHTEGMLSIIIHGNDKTLAIPCDLVPTSANVPLTWISAYDNNPELLLKEKTDFLNEAYIKNWFLFFEHDSFHEVCTLAKSEKGFHVDRFYSLSEINFE